MTNEACIQRLQEAAARLHKLLQDPQPGLSSWAMMLGEAVQPIVDWHSGKWADED